MAIPALQGVFPGTWVFDGECRPEVGANAYRYETFTLGIFQVEKTSNGKSTKRGKVVSRVSGFMSNPRPAVETARDICTFLNDGGSHENLRKRIPGGSCQEEWFSKKKK